MISSTGRNAMLSLPGKKILFRSVPLTAQAVGRRSH